jgi:hypothetical protein
VQSHFQITVLGAGPQLQALLAYVNGLPPGTSLPSKVQTAINYHNANDIHDTCTALTAVINRAKGSTSAFACRVPLNETGAPVGIGIVKAGSRRLQMHAGDDGTKARRTCRISRG